MQPSAGDRRFTDAAWTDNPFYHAWLQAYLRWSDQLRRGVDRLGLPPDDTQRAHFVLRQLTDALAPTNTLAGNPAALKRLFETGGGSGLRGFKHMLDDLLLNRGMPSQVDKQAFRVGGNLAASPGAVVFRNEVLELIQYAASTESVRRRPLLAVPPQINKFYVLDLAPGKSLFEYLAANGLQPFTLSWRNPTPAQRSWGLERYKRAIVEATDAVLQITGSEDLNILGACSGGITTALLLRDMWSRGDPRVHAASMLVTALSGAVDSQLGVFATPETLEAARVASQATGVLDGAELARVFAWLRPNDLVWNYWVNNYLMGEDPPQFDVLYWNNDTTNLPARLHHDFLNLIGKPIDLSGIECDTYFVAGMTDHISPWKSCYASAQMFKRSQCQFVLSSSGHVQSILNPPGNPKAKFFINTSMPGDAEAWMAGAAQHAGSWWEHWKTWLVERSGDCKKAPRQLGSQRYPAMEPAPGTYVLDA